MILSGLEILKRLGSDIIIEPFNKKQLNPNSYNLRLHDEMLVYKNEVLDVKKENPCERILIPEKGFTLQPGKLYLARTVERTATNNLVPMLEGRSSIGRLGLFVHITAGFGDVGFEGYWTLEMHCIHPITVYPFIEICQIYYHDITKPFEVYQSGKYQSNSGIQPSLMFKEFQDKT